MIFTIGHSNHTIELFIKLLVSHNIDLLVDVRTTPYSKYSPQYNRENLSKSLKENNISYLHKGDSLGGMPEDRSVLESTGRISLEKIQSKNWFQKGIDEIIELSKTHRLALMCAEEDPKRCHRGHIITNTLLKMNYEIWHIRKDSSLQKAEFLSKQENLFS
jgi:uncharacterized protein (DUF488 family)